MSLLHLAPVTRQEERVREMLFRPLPTISFELFPPRGADSAKQLDETLEALLPLDPDFVSVTWSSSGLPGSTRDLTVRLLRRGIHVVPHLISRGRSPEFLDRLIAEWVDLGVRDVLALRGDPPPAGQTTVDLLPHARDLVSLIRRKGHPIGIGGACYPEGHLESPDRRRDIDNLREKIAAGVEYLITQAFFDPAFYFDFLDRCRRARIDIPVLPGILPVVSLPQVEKLGRMWGVTVPRKLQLSLESCGDDVEAARQVGIQHTLSLCRDLLDRGAPGIHVFTMNRAAAAREIMETVSTLRQSGARATIH